MTEEEQKALLEEVKALKASLANVVEEVKTERKTKQDAQAESEALKLKIKEVEDKQKAGATGDDVEAKVRAILNEDAKKSADSARVVAEQKWKANHTEFSETNDPGGVKFAAIKGKLSRLSDQGLSSENDFIGLFEDAYVLVKKERNIDSHDYNPYAASNSSNGGAPKETNANNLSAKEEKLMKMEGWDKEKYLKMKAKRPSFVESLLQYVN